MAHTLHRGTCGRKTVLWWVLEQDQADVIDGLASDVAKPFHQPIN
jgi:hypothetical protein